MTTVPQLQENQASTKCLSVLDDTDDDLYMFDCFDIDEILPSENPQTTNIIQNKSSSQCTSKRPWESKDNFRQKRHCPFPRSTCCNTTQPMASPVSMEFSGIEPLYVPQSPASVTSIAFQGLQEASFRKRFDKTLSMLAISMKRSAISRTIIIRHQNQQAAEIKEHASSSIPSCTLFASL